MTTVIQDNNNPIDIRNNNEKNKLNNVETTKIVSRTPSANVIRNNANEKRLGDSTSTIINKINDIVVTNSIRNTKRVVKNWQIFKMILATLNGKDKLAKILKCIIDIYIKFFGNNLIFKHNSRNINLSFISKQLGFFRYALRFGTLPFKLIGFSNKLWNERKNLSNLTKDTDGFGKGNILIQDLIDIYYCTFDELDFTYKLNILTDRKFFQTVSKHEAWAWQLDIINSIKNNNIKLNKLNSKLVNCNIKINTIEMTHSNNGGENDEITSRLNDELQLDRQFENLQSEKIELTHMIRLTKLDLYRLTMDLLANSSDISHSDKYLPKASYATLSLFSGCIGFYKTFIDNKFNSTK